MPLFLSYIALLLICLHNFGLRTMIVLPKSNFFGILRYAIATNII